MYRLYLCQNCHYANVSGGICPFCQVTLDWSRSGVTARYQAYQKLIGA